MTLGGVKKDVCKGCMMGREYTLCYFEELDIEEKCPCVECLVKVMCNESCSKRDGVKYMKSIDFTGTGFKPKFKRVVNDSGETL